MRLEFGSIGAEAFGVTSRLCVGSVVVRQGAGRCSFQFPAGAEFFRSNGQTCSETH